MNFFPYGFSKEEIYKKLSDVEDLVYVGIILLSLVMCNLIAKLAHYCAFGDKTEETSENTTLSPLIAKSAKTSSRMMGMVHIMFFVNGLSHLFHVGWLVDVLWYPMWITAWTVKIYTEMYLIVISLFSISRYFVHFSVAQPSVELTPSAVNSGIRWITALMVFKDLILAVWLIVVLEMEKFEVIGRILDYFYGFYWSYQLILFLATFMLFLVMRGPTRVDIQPSPLEKMIYFQTIGAGVFKMILIAIFLALVIRGINDTVLSALSVMVDLLWIPIVIQVSEIWYKPKKVDSAAIQKTLEEVEMN